MHHFKSAMALVDMAVSELGGQADDWVITKSLFEYTTGGSCACCSFPATLFDPDGIKGLINSVSDLETDDAEQEIKAAIGEGGVNEKSQSPWPIEMRDSIWSDLVNHDFRSLATCIKPKLLIVSTKIFAFGYFISQHNTSYL